MCAKRFGPSPRTKRESGSATAIQRIATVFSMPCRGTGFARRLLTRQGRHDVSSKVRLEGDRVFLHDAFQEVEEIFPALRDLIDNSRASVRRKDGRPVDEPPLKQLRELLIDGGPSDLEFLRQVLRMIEPLREQTQDLASRL